jgi:hypothetical protein
MRFSRRAGFTAGLVCLAAAASAQDHRLPAPAGARVYFIEPANGASIAGPVTVKMGIAGMGVAPAGVQFNNTGHHHILINQPAFDPLVPIPMDDANRHFGAGQTETVLTLPPGTYTLQLVFADFRHIPHNPPVQSELITITVR